MGLFVCAPSRAAAALRGLRTYQPRVLPVEEADEVGRADAEHRPAVPIYYSTGPPNLFIAPAPLYLFIAPALPYLFIAPARRTYI